jgi:hypothetical protein
MTQSFGRDHRKFERQFNRLQGIRGRRAGPPPRRLVCNPTAPEALTTDLQFTQSSNINSTDESCGKLKATRFARFVLRRDEAFSRRRCGGGTIMPPLEKFLELLRVGP